MNRLLEIMARLRDPESGCPWDLKQDFSTIAPYTIEEAYEVADAIVHADMPALRDELGDLLLQVVFHAQMAKESGHFDFSQVAQGIVDKMVRRHPHVFGNAESSSVDEVKRSWEDIKSQERADAGKSRESAMDDVVAGMPALARAYKLQQRAAEQGFDWVRVREVLYKVREEIDELELELDTEDSERVEQELGDVLFSVVNLARHLAVNPEMALASANARFATRFQHLERHVNNDSDPRPLRERSIEELEVLWQAAKQALGSSPPPLNPPESES